MRKTFLGRVGIVVFALTLLVTSQPLGASYCDCEKCEGGILFADCVDVFWEEMGNCDCRETGIPILHNEGDCVMMAEFCEVIIVR